MKRCCLYILSNIHIKNVSNNSSTSWWTPYVICTRTFSTSSSSAKLAYMFMGSHTTKSMFTFQILMQTLIWAIKDIQKSWRNTARWMWPPVYILTSCSSHTKNAEKLSIQLNIKNFIHTNWKHLVAELVSKLASASVSDGIRVPFNTLNP